MQAKVVMVSDECDSRSNRMGMATTTTTQIIGMSSTSKGIERSPTLRPLAAVKGVT